MLLLGSRGKLSMNKINKITMIVSGLVFMLLITMFPGNLTKLYASEWNHAYTYYQTYGNSVVFCPKSKTDGNIYYATKAATATTKTRYRTIGWKLSVRDLDGKHLQTIYFKLGGFYMNRVHTVKKSGYEYDLYSMSLYNLKKRLNAKADDAVKGGKAKFVLDACMIVVKDGNAKGEMNDSGPVSGKVYTNYSGISGAESWSSSSYASFSNYFDKEIEGLFFLVDTIEGTGISSVRGGGYYCYGSYVTLEAKVKQGYEFEMWDGTYRNANIRYSFYVNEDAKCFAIARKKVLHILFYRNLSPTDTVGAEQRLYYGDGGVKLDRMSWSAEGKKLKGWALKPDAVKKDFSLSMIVKDSWIAKYSPKIELYAVWENVNEPEKLEPDNPEPDIPDPDIPEPDTPDHDIPDYDTPKPDQPGQDTSKPDNPKPDNPEPDNPIPPDVPEPEYPDQPDSGEEEPETNKIIKIHCRFISEKYFEDANQNLIPQERGGLKENSKWAEDPSLRVWLRQILKSGV